MIRNPFRRRWAVIAHGLGGARWIAARTWTRSGAVIARMDLEEHDRKRDFFLLDAGIAAVLPSNTNYLVGPVDKLEGPWT